MINNLKKNEFIEYGLTVMIEDKFVEHSATGFLPNVTVNDLRPQFI